MNAIFVWTFWDLLNLGLLILFVIASLVIAAPLLWEKWKDR